MLYHCRILGSQDTLFDHLGRHYFFHCFIQGSIDIIFGSARSLYQVKKQSCLSSGGIKQRISQKLFWSRVAAFTRLQKAMEQWRHRRGTPCPIITASPSLTASWVGKGRCIWEERGGDTRRWCTPIANWRASCCLKGGATGETNHGEGMHGLIYLNPVIITFCFFFWFRLKWVIDI